MNPFRYTLIVVTDKEPSCTVFSAIIFFIVFMTGFCLKVLFNAT